MMSSQSHWQIHARRHPILLHHLCLLRGFDVAALAPDYRTHLHDPFLLPDMEAACQIFLQTIRDGGAVTVFGDYDADGTPAAALLSVTLRHLGVQHQVILPTRESGYGLRTEQVEEIAKHSQLLITVDTGVSSVAEIARAKELGLAVIVLDHHLPGAVLPPADAVVDPYRTDSAYPFAHLCGCALAYKFVVALSRDCPQITEQFTKWLLDLVAISTVADMMPLVDENRALVHYGLLVLRQNRRPGLRALLERAGLKPESLTAGTLGFVIGPRLNAAGRLGDNTPALDLLRDPDPTTVSSRADLIEAANTKRQELVSEVMAEADAELFRQNNQNDPVYFVAKLGWPAGVVGLVAGKLAGQYHRPVLVGTIENGLVRGSARSISAYPIVDAFERLRAHLQTFGGHTAAAGFSLDERNLEAFRRDLLSDAKSVLKSDDLRKTQRIDAEVTDRDLDKRSVTDIEKLQPYGLSNHRPLFLIRRGQLTKSRRIGRDNSHLKAVIQAPVGSVEMVAFGLAEALTPQAASTLDMVGYLETNRWNNTESVQFQVVDYRSASDSLEVITNG